MQTPIKKKLKWIAAVVGSLFILSLIPLLRTLLPVFYLWTFRHGDVEYVPYLTETLHSSNSSVQGAAAGALGRIGPDAKSSVPQLLKILREDNNPAAPKAAWALGRIGESTSETIDALIMALKSHDRQVAMYAAYALGDMGVEASQAIPALREQINDPLAGLNVVRAFGDIGARQAVPDIAKLLDSSDFGIRIESMIALEKLQPLEPQIVAKIRALQNDEDERVRHYASKVLSSIK